VRSSPRYFRGRSPGPALAAELVRVTFPPDFPGIAVLIGAVETFGSDRSRMGVAALITVWAG